MESFRKTILLLGLLAGAACGSSHTERICDVAVACELIEEDESSRCMTDLEDALDADEVTRKDVRECRRCIDGAGCGLNVIVDCAEECEGVAPRVTGSSL